MTAGGQNSMLSSDVHVLVSKDQIHGADRASRALLTRGAQAGLGPFLSFISISVNELTTAAYLTRRY